MKIYNEITMIFNEETNSWDTIYEDSYEEYGEIAQLKCGQYEGDDEIREQDNELKKSAFGQLDVLYQDYARMVKPDGFFGQKIRRLQEDTLEQQQQKADAFNLAKKQSQRAHSEGTTNARMNFLQSQQEIENNMDNLMEKTRMEAMGARQAAADDAYAVSQASARGGLAGVGGRAREMLGRKKQSGIDAISLGLRMQQQSLDAQLAKAETSRNQAMTSSASAMRTANETAEMGMNQSRADLGRKLENDVADVVEAREKAKSQMLSQALALKGQTVGSFKEQFSRWDGSGDNIDDPGENNWHSYSDHKGFQGKFAQAIDEELEDA